MFILVAALLQAGAQPPQHTVPNAGSVTDSLRIFYIGRSAGWEHYQLTQTKTRVTLTSDYDYVDRGRRNHTQLTLSAASDYSLDSLEIVRITDTSRTVATSVKLAGTRASFTRNGVSQDAVSVPVVSYAVSGYAPTAQHLALIRYWQAHG